MPPSVLYCRNLVPLCRKKLFSAEVNMSCSTVAFIAESNNPWYVLRFWQGECFYLLKIRLFTFGKLGMIVFYKVSGVQPYICTRRFYICFALREGMGHSSPPTFLQNYNKHNNETYPYCSLDNWLFKYNDGSSGHVIRCQPVKEKMI